MRLTELLDEARAENGGTDGPDELTVALLRKALKEPYPADVLYPAVFAWVQAAERSRVRAVERQAFGKPESVYVNPAQDAMAQLLAQRVYVPGEGMVPWGLLTEPMHRRRISYLEDTLRNYTAGMRESVARHVKAVEVLEESGCGTLEEYAVEYGELPVDPPER